MAAFPFSAIVGQDEMKRALLIAAVEPRIGGVMVFGDRGTGKSTAARALAALLPPMKVVAGCRFNCDPAGVKCSHGGNGIYSSSGVAISGGAVTANGGDSKDGRLASRKVWNENDLHRRCAYLARGLRQRGRYRSDDPIGSARERDPGLHLVDPAIRHRCSGAIRIARAKAGPTSRVTSAPTANENATDSPT